MKKLILAVLVALFSVSLYGTANAGPVAAVVAVVVSAIKASIVLKILAVAVLGVASSMLKKAMAKKPIPSGIKIDRTLTGGTVSRGVLLGFYCTAGSQVAPPMSHGQDGKTPNAYLTKVIALSDMRTTDLTAVVLNGELIEINKASVSEYGWALTGKYAGKAWVKFYDGTQTTADGSLVSRYASYIRPWGSDRIGTGVSYAIATFKFDNELYKQDPEIKFELYGAKLYDPRFDTSVGGSGAQSWNDLSTHQFTTNTVVQIYNIIRGLRLEGGQVYGGVATAEDLPLANWVAAMNVCDEVTATSDKRYQSGYEIAVADEQPADVIEELLKACSGSISEVGGVYKIRCGPPSLPVGFITDEDIYVSEERQFDPYPTIDGSVNTVYAAYPHPGECWNTHDAPPVTNATYVAEDDGVEQSADIQFPAAPFPLQVQRNMQAWLKDDRRWRRHTISMGPYAFVYEPLDVIAWTSAHNQYTNKSFEIGLTSVDLARLNSSFSMREVDPSDYDWTAGSALPDPVSPGVWDLPAVQAVPGWAFVASSVQDAAGVARRPAVLCSWTPDGAEDAKLLKIQVRLAVTQAMVCEATVTKVDDGSLLISEGILASTSYEARAQYTLDRPTEWSAWIGATTGNILFTDDDLNSDKLNDVIVATEELNTAVEQAQSDATDALNALFDPTNGALIQIEALEDQDAIFTSQIAVLDTDLGAAVGRIDDLETSNRSLPNLIKNGNAADPQALRYWTAPSGGFVVGVDPLYGPYFGALGNTSGSTRVLTSDVYSAAPGNVLSLSLSGDPGGSTGSARAFVFFTWTRNGVQLGNSSPRFLESSVISWEQRAKLENVTVPATVAGQVPNGYQITYAAPNGHLNSTFSLIMVNEGVTALPFNNLSTDRDTLARVRTTEIAQATTDGALAALTQQVAVSMQQGASIVANARYGAYTTSPGVPDGFVNYANATGATRQSGQGANYAVRLAPSAGQEMGYRQVITVTSGRWVVEGQAATSSTWQGAGILVDKAGGGLVAQINFATDPDNAGVISASGTGLRRFTATFDVDYNGSANIYAFANWVGFGTQSAKVIDFYVTDFYPVDNAVVAADAKAQLALTSSATNASALAAFELEADTRFDGVEATVTTQGAAISDLEGSTAAFETEATTRFEGIESTVSIQGTSITDLEDKVGAARLVLSTAASGGKPNRFTLYSDTLGTNFVAIEASEIYFGDNSVFDDTTDTLRTVTNSVATVIAWGASFGGDAGGATLRQWVGPDSVALASMTRANAVFYQADTPPYIGGTAISTGDSALFKTNAGTGADVTSTSYVDIAVLAFGNIPAPGFWTVGGLLAVDATAPIQSSSSGDVRIVERKTGSPDVVIAALTAWSINWVSGDGVYNTVYGQPSASNIPSSYVGAVSIVLQGRKASGAAANPDDTSYSIQANWIKGG